MEHKFSFQNEDRRTYFERINEKLSNISSSEISSTISKVDFYIEHFSIIGKQKTAYRKQVDFLKEIKKVLNFEQNRRVCKVHSLL